MKKFLKSMIGWCDSTLWPWLKAKKSTAAAVITAIVGLAIVIPTFLFITVPVMKFTHWHRTWIEWIVLPILAGALTVLLWDTGKLLFHRGKLLTEKTGGWCYRIAWPKFKSAGGWTYRKTAPKAKWLWDHKADKKVWIPLGMIGGVILLVLGYSFAIHILKSLFTGTMPWWKWILFTGVGLSVAIFEIGVWILVWQRTWEGKKVGKIHLWILVPVGLLFVLWLVWKSLKGYLTEGFDWWMATVPYPIPVAIVVVLVIALLAIQALKPKTPAPAHAASGGHGGHEHAAGLGAGGALLIIFALMTAASGVTTWLGLGKSETPAGNANNRAAINEGPYIRVTAQTDVWTPKIVGAGLYAHWAIEGPGHILYKTDKNPTEVEDWSGQQVIQTAPVGPYTVFFKAKGPNPVNVRLYLR
ncbi:hypothetical protein KGQ31_03460 [Patescibacteria group bacterium]|nr:hypothetical protein [Patescibacteria group bacterium]